jgi:HK97 family phage major capsid protein
MTDLTEVAAEVKREIARIGDDTKKLHDTFQRDLKAARDLAEEGKADAGAVKALLESATTKFETLEAKQRESEARVLSEVDKVGAALRRVHQGDRSVDLPKATHLEALEFKKAAMSVRDEAKAQSFRTLQLGDGDVERYAEYCKAFETLCRKGEKSLSSEEYKALTTGSDPNGGYVVPAAMSQRIMTIVYETSPMDTIATVETIGTDRLEIPIDEGEGACGWVGEEESRAETGTATFGVQVIPVHEIYAKPRATQRVLEDSSLDLEGWLARKNGDKMARTANTAFISGNGVKKARGLMSYTSSASAASRGTPMHYVSGAAALLTPDVIKNLPLKALKEPYHPNARWLMKRAALAAIAIFRDDSGASAGTGQYLWTPGLRDNSIQSQLAGYPITLADDMPAVGAGNFPVAFGDFRQAYTIVRRLGITTLRDPYSAKPFVEFYSRMRVGADVTNFEAFVLIKCST